jgi:hypothetical protein
MSIQKINLQNPCPMTLNRMKSGDTFFCKSCDKKIVDFREKTTEEIMHYFSNSTGSGCGIFKRSQVNVSEYSFRNKILYKLLTILAVLGLNVKPLEAQTKKEILNDSASTARRTVNSERSIENKATEKVETKKKISAPTEKKKKRRREKKKVKFRDDTLAGRYL